jgi:dGTPase
MNWNTIISARRTGESESASDIRTNFQRDFDRLIFSSAFRRLQNKTQIFPLPGSVFVHNRLTHSLEVASVGRTLGKMAGEKLIKAGLIDEFNKDFYSFELQNVIASACLAHDIGNPPFGHSGEKAVSTYFMDNKAKNIGEQNLQSYFTQPQWSDLINFEGNANSLRVLTHQFNGKSTGGYRLTYATLAALIKYPCTSEATDKANIYTKKYGFFQSETETAKSIYKTLNIPVLSETPLIYKRHPFVYLTEAADDICYRIIDFEDAQRLHILSHDEVSGMFLEILNSIGRDDIDHVNEVVNTIGDKNEKITYLRAKCINALTLEAAELFVNNAQDILTGNFNSGLLDYIEKQNPVLKKISNISVEKIYNHHTVVELEITGFKVMSELLGLFIPAVLTQNPGHKDQKVLRLLPEQFKANSDEPYHKVMAVLDYLSGMTDPFIIELYRKTFGIEINWHV